jgi:ankyrin repeat protein
LDFRGLVIYGFEDVVRRMKVVRLLLKKGADIVAAGGEYATALQAASRNGLQKIVQILLDNGADVNLNKKGWKIRQRVNVNLACGEMLECVRG